MNDAKDESAHLTTTPKFKKESKMKSITIVEDTCNLVTPSNCVSDRFNEKSSNMNKRADADEKEIIIPPTFDNDLNSNVLNKIRHEFDSGSINNSTGNFYDFSLVDDSDDGNGEISILKNNTEVEDISEVETENDVKLLSTCVKPKELFPSYSEEKSNMKTQEINIMKKENKISDPENSNLMTTSVSSTSHHDCKNTNSLQETSIALSKSNIPEISSIPVSSTSKDNQYKMASKSSTSTTRTPKNDTLFDKHHECFISGLSLSSDTIKGRINHIKLCSKNDAIAKDSNADDLNEFNSLENGFPKPIDKNSVITIEDEDDNDVYNTSSISDSLNHRIKNDKENQDKKINTSGPSRIVDKWYIKCKRSLSDDSSSSDSDDDNDPILRKIREMARKSSPYRKMNKPGRKEAIDSIIQNQGIADAALQCLLWAEVGCSYDLFPHQFIAVRAAAGVVENFPCLNGLDDKMIGFYKESHTRRTETLDGCSLDKMLVCTPGLILADKMGLGKTVVGVAAIMLRKYIYEQKGEKKLPTLIIGPNDAVLDQWKVTLLNAGVTKCQLHVMNKSFSPNHMKKIDFKSFQYVLFTRHKLQAEMKRLMESTTMQNPYTKSILFPHAKKELVRKLRTCYRFKKGEERANFRRKGESIEDCVTRIISEATRSNLKGCIKASFRSIIIDEAHFHRNLLAYWGLAAALLGSHSQRMLLLTGTPYNNGPMDMAALMTFVNPFHEASFRRWWEKATSTRADSFRNSVKEWREKYMLRRGKDALKGKIKSKTVSVMTVSPYPVELAVYEAYEHTFLRALQCMNEFLDDDSSPLARKRLNDAFEIMMAAIQCMRMSLIHPLMPGGREATIAFSPTRKHLTKREENPFVCVCCGVNFPSNAADEFKTKIKEGRKDYKVGKGDDETPLLGTNQRIRTDVNLDDENLNDEDYDKERSEQAPKRFVKSTVPLHIIGADLCSATHTDCPHYAHSQCIENLRANGHSCPKCSDLQKRIHYLEDEDKGKTPHSIYCKNIKLPYSLMPGFTASTKIEKVIEWVKQIPENEKAIIVSFFKGSLDLMEGILVYDLKIGCARFDGDVLKDERAMDLERFKTCKDVRFLLMSIQSGGTGLNIVEANHMCFLDRWFNPCVHEQAEDRCWRIGQHLPVKIKYADCAMTIDQVMAAINTLKSANSSVVLADGTDLGVLQSTLGYNDLTGVIGRGMQSAKAQRYAHMKLSELNKYSPLPSADLDSIMDDEKTDDRKNPFLLDNNSSTMGEDSSLNNISIKGEDSSVNHDSLIEECISNGYNRTSASQMVKNNNFKPITGTCNDDSSIDEPVFVRKTEKNTMLRNKKRSKHHTIFSENDQSSIDKHVSIGYSGRSSLQKVENRSCKPIAGENQTHCVIRDNSDSLIDGPVFVKNTEQCISPVKKTESSSTLRNKKRSKCQTIFSENAPIGYSRRGALQKVKNKNYKFIIESIIIDSDDSSSIDDPIFFRKTKTHVSPVKKRRSSLFKDKKRSKHSIILSENDESSIEEPVFMKKNFSQDGYSMEASISVSSKKKIKSIFANNADSIDLAKQVKLMNKPIVIDLEKPVFLKKDATQKETYSAQHSNHSTSNEARAQDSAPMDNLTVRKDDLVEIDYEQIHNFDTKSKTLQNETENDAPMEEDAALKKSSQNVIENKHSKNLEHQETQHETDNDHQHPIPSSSNKDRLQESAQMDSSIVSNNDFVESDFMQIDNADALIFSFETENDASMEKEAALKKSSQSNSEILMHQE